MKRCRHLVIAFDDDRAVRIKTNTVRSATNRQPLQVIQHLCRGLRLLMVGDVHLGTLLAQWGDEGVGDIDNSNPCRYYFASFTFVDNFVRRTQFIKDSRLRFGMLLETVPRDPGHARSGC